MINKIEIFLSKKQRLHLIFLFLGILISTNLEMIGLGSIPIFINLLLKPDQLLAYIPPDSFMSFIVYKDYSYQVLFSAICLTVFFIFKNTFIFITGYFQAVIFRDIRVDSAKRLFQSYLNSPYSFHLDRNPAIITRNITAEVANGSSHISSLINVFREILLIVVIFILLLLVNPGSTLTAFLLVGLFAIVFYVSIRKKTINLSKDAQYNRGRQVQLVNQVFGAIKDAKILARESYFINEFENETKGAERINLFSEIITKIPRLSMEIFAVISISAVTFILIVREGNSVTDMLPLLGLLGISTIRIIPSFNSITTTLTKMRRSIVSFNLIANELKNLEKYSNEKNNLEKKKENEDIFFNKNIKLENITYEYPNSNKNVLKNITFKIKSGSFIGIIGKTGSGKSTLVDIILGLLEPIQGQVIVGDYNINRDYLTWQKRVGYISQDVYIVDDTIKRNIAFGLSDYEIDDGRIKFSLQLAQLNDFILNLPNGLNTIVGNRGIRLSGGQKQRLGIARALYRKSKILILDEATSSLDIATEKKLINDIESLSGNHTIIVITHRLSTIKNCDNVILLSEGKLIDQGKFNDLSLRHQYLKADFLEKKNK